LRFLAFTSLAVMPLLILPRYLEPDPAGYVVALSPDALPLASNAPQIAAWLLVGGMAVLLMMGPFYGQLVAIGIHSAPMALPLMITIFPVAVLHTLFRLWEAQPTLVQDPLFFQACLWMGIVTTGVGGLAAIGQRRWGALAGYAALVDWGAGLIALGQGTMAGIELSVQMLIWRALSMLLVGTGLSALFRATRSQDDLAHCRGLYLGRPLSVAALLIGLLSLAGYPLTPGAVGRWPLLVDLASGQPVLSETETGFLARWIGQLPNQPEALWVLLLASVGVTVGAIASVLACLRAPQENASKESVREGGIAPGRTGRAEHVDAVVSAGFALLALWLVGTLLLQPQPWISLGQELLGNLSFPGS
jgi:formate hydrogenlyase subunit 3/multisubunit Na+/H+ antiporter MnhD subunit